MLSLFRKRKSESSIKKNDTQERLANSIVSACIRIQQKWADFMQRHTERFSRNGKLIILSFFCLSAGGLSLYLIGSSVSSRKASSITVIHLKKPSYAGKSGDENTKALVLVSKTEYEKVQRFRHYMDSLTRSPSGKILYDSILIHRPGLMDSVMIIEELYKAKK